MPTKEKLSITQVKLDIRNILQNLKLLETPQNLKPEDLKTLQESTLQMLTNLEKQPLRNIKKKTKSRKLERQRRRRKKLQLKSEETSLPMKAGNEFEMDSAPIKHISDLETKSHHRLRIRKECQNYLDKFNLLQQLHLARSHDAMETSKFAEKLEKMKVIWNSLLQDQNDDEDEQACSIEQQWQTVLFGGKDTAVSAAKKNMKYFLRIRHHWDSCIDAKHGSSIPVGWVLPPLTPNEQWSKYMLKED